jgi:pyruvate/2-oxoglutarate dehydrogenase complex dihydrolipoamide dehydrogenase (E3) component
MRHADRWAIAPAQPEIDLARVMERVAGVIRGIEPNDSPERFRSLGVEVILGDGRFTAPDVFEVAGRRLTARHFVIATGSRPAVPPIPGLADVRFLTNETLFALRENVPHLLILGAGPIGCEMAQAFHRLGSEVTVVDQGSGILPREDRDLAEAVQRTLEREGVRFHLGAKVESVEGSNGDVRLTIREHDGAVRTPAGTHLLVAAGRLANTEGLGLDAAGVEVENGRIVSTELATTNPRISVIGDAAGGYQFTHDAEHHAGIVLRRAIFRMGWAKPSPVVPWCTYTDPELARVGVSEAEAKARGVAHAVYRFPLEDIDRARAEGETEGLAKIVTDPRGRLLGAGIVAPHAGELVAEYALAIAHGMKAADISGTIHPYPTFSMVNRRAADQRMKEGLTPNAKTWIRRIFGLRGR